LFRTGRILPAKRSSQEGDGSQRDEDPSISLSEGNHDSSGLKIGGEGSEEDPEYDSESNGGTNGK
jgi:hypothetical protein